MTTEQKEKLVSDFVLAVNDNKHGIYAVNYEELYLKVWDAVETSKDLT